MNLILLFLSVFFFSNSFPQSGHLVIIGGGNRTEKIMKKIIELAGGTESKIIIIPNASSVPEKTARYQTDEFRNLGCPNVDFIVADLANVNDMETLKKLDNVNCIFFSGGDQNRLTKALLGSEMLEKIKDIYKSGGVISGTSAGAAVISEIMITGDEIFNKDTTVAFNTIMKGNIKFTEGFGFLKDAIVDQHFIKRKRNNRLISLVLEHPEKLGLGIDESTAAVVYPDYTMEVIGENQVVIFDASGADEITVSSNNNLSASGIVMHILSEGQKFDLKNKTLIR